MLRSNLAPSLAAATASRSLVRMTRHVESGHIDGYIVAFSRHWFLVLVVGEGVHYSGFQAFRPRDVQSFSVPSPRAAFVRAVMRKRGLRRPARPAIDLSSTQALICSAAKRFPLVTLHREIVDPEVCHIGKLADISSRLVSLIEITTDAQWGSEPTAYRLSEITRVDFGGPYEEALALVAHG